MAATGFALGYSQDIPIVHLEAAAAAVDLKKVREAILDVIDADIEKRGDGSSLAGTFIRLAWHSSGTYSAADNSGGSNGARQRFDPEASFGNNAGLHIARKALEPVKAKFPELSYADLYTYSGVVAVEEAGGPNIPFRTGRVDMDSGETSPQKDVLPNADMGSRVHTVQHLRDIFYRMGFTDQEVSSFFSSIGCELHVMKLHFASHVFVLPQ